MSSTASYVIRVRPESHELDVELTLTGLSPGPLKLATPTWVPGAYGFMKYGRDLFSVQAADGDGASLKVARDGWSGFAVNVPIDRVVVRYTAYAFDPAWGELAGVVDTHQAVLLGTRYLFAPSHDGPCRVEYRFPLSWQVHHPAGAKQVGTHVFEYPSYAVLLDTPVVAGEFERRTRTLHGVEFHHVFLDRSVGFATEAESFIDSVMAVAQQCHEIFGSFPFESFTFVYTFNPKAHWGLEHANATMIALGPNALIDDGAWFDAVRVAAHELFHAWNVCRLKPAALMKPDLVHGSFPDELWISEGVTRYYEFLLSVRAGECAPEVFLSNLVNYFRHHEALPSCDRVSPADSSRTTFLNHNRYAGSVNNTVDYYDAGMLVAFGLDATLRLAGDTDSLDQAFAAFYRAFREQGFTNGDAQQFFGQRLPAAGELIEHDALTPGNLSTVTILHLLGFEALFSYTRFLGVVLQDNQGPLVASVLDTAPAARSGLAPGDEILRVCGFPFDLTALKWMVRHEETLTLEVKRGARLHACDIRVSERVELERVLWKGDDAQLERLRRWFGAPEFTLTPGQSIPLDHYSNFHGIQTVL
jgi:predicted metalloprotease with PDZ domain